jgi:hypothetical protein
MMTLVLVMGIVPALFGAWAIVRQKVTFINGDYYTGEAAIFIGWGLVIVGASAIAGLLVSSPAFVLCVWPNVFVFSVPLLRGYAADALTQKRKRKPKYKRKRKNEGL